MVNLEAVRVASTIVMVQAVAFREEVLDRADGRDKRRTGRFIGGPELRGPSR